MGTIHSGALTPGSRLWPLFLALQTRRLTTRQITDEFRLCSASTEIAALRVEAPKHGWRVPLRPEYLGLTEDGRKVYRYRMERTGGGSPRARMDGVDEVDRVDAGALATAPAAAEQLVLVGDVDGRDA